MMNATEQVGLKFETYQELSEGAKELYNTMFDYFTYSPDPRYKHIHEFRKRITSYKGKDFTILQEYFNNEPAIQWHGQSAPPWEYFKDPY